ncbi:hypothetical protein V6N13_038336 [Hibiscus sabdariffa]|uniref:Factor of DNA methylation 1-5/IDN2 domain-containing protein n=1 Tax=Hibiscus sabdariffa TaxID=183260 RepID=A0ABR2S2Z4_9ROSI
MALLSYGYCLTSKSWHLALIHDIAGTNPSVEMAKRDLEEELKKERRLVGSLLCEIDYRKQQLYVMEHGHNETTSTLRGHIDSLVAEMNYKDCILRNWEVRYNGTVTQFMAENAVLRKEIRKVNEEDIKLKHELRLQTKELRECKSKYNNDPERRTLLNETGVLKENVPCQSLVETLSSQIAALKKELQETSEALEDIESRYSCLLVKNLLANQELQDARKESINGLNDILNTKTTLGIKRMGDINEKAFEVACSQKLPNEDWQETCAKLCSLWQQNVQDPKWHPFKIIDIRANLQQVIDEDDRKLKELRNEYGDTAFEAVGAALMEMNEYNASGTYPVPEVWNRKEGWKATMKEIIEYIIRQLKIHKGKGKRMHTYM